jgi:hypothetical protein
MARANNIKLDLGEFVRESTKASGVPERLEDPGAIYDVVTLLAGVKPSSAALRSRGQ